MLRNFSFAALFAVLAPVTQATEFTWSSTTDPQTMDPHAVNSAPVLGFLNNVYEGLVRRGPDMAIEPALATSWEAIGEGAGWRFNLRRDVTFHDGAEFTAQDVLFSYERAASDAADTSSWFAPVSEVILVDDFTVDFMTTAPNPIFPDSIANWMIMDSDWAVANDATRPDKERGNHATLHANGTGAFAITSREPGLRTVLEPHAGWWGAATHNITRAEFTPIQNPATAIAALLSGEVDFINPVPVQDVARLQQDANIRVIQGIEARVIMLGFPHEAEALKYSAETPDANPFTDPRVRRAVAHAINVPAILQTTMRGNAEAVNQLVSPAMRGYSDALAGQPPYDPDAARALLAEAGYPDGFSFGFKCPNDRYLNDEAVCQAITAMLSQVGMRATLDAMPVQTYWPELRADNYDMYLLGWSPGTFDAEHPIRFLAATPNAEKRLGSWNFGGYSNARVDELLPMIQSEIDEPARQAMLDEVAQILQRDTAYVPLYVQPLVWGTRAHIDLVQRPDNFFILRWVSLN
ncbi:ABC transporter substrate-binding protein [Roseobacter denitrificans]|uniref:Bacterial extracellular solute-binding proteins, family 5 n=1 Tax=Roseobacter denitrificans (strain ATCC 33942 / OCh 114) TaxID=375451 RepID=Q167M6_ROSDO|nr:ABC transporter substrate-binding protein [Roseobacter denitrificans]ABG31817.1 bacterial extracellular solute-binding proteins, family 5 [Roseobacter denitrificans OCh 114]AVL51382.1 ABC transporter substrate-binding protein [Roseobacter denitrificans]SFF86578.1 peptide/nickel transport system substrate-binding protein [Roseobacter denitrificans OCh 114]